MVEWFEDEIYIKMSIKAKEIQKLWKRKNYDFCTDGKKSGCLLLLQWEDDTEGLFALWEITEPIFLGK